MGMIKYPNRCITFPLFHIISGNHLQPLDTVKRQIFQVPTLLSIERPSSLSAFRESPSAPPRCIRNRRIGLKDYVATSLEEAGMLILKASGASPRRTASRRTGFSGTAADAEGREDLFQFNTAAVRTPLFSFTGRDAHQQLGLFTTLCTAICIYRHNQSPRFNFFGQIRIP